MHQKIPISHRNIRESDSMSDHERSPHPAMTSTDTIAGEATDGGGKHWRPGTLSTASVAIEPGNQRNTQKWEHKDIEKEFWQVWFDCRDRLYPSRS